MALCGSDCDLIWCDLVSWNLITAAHTAVVKSPHLLKPLYSNFYIAASVSEVSFIISANIIVALPQPDKRELVQKPARTSCSRDRTQPVEPELVAHHAAGVAPEQVAPERQ
jgi:hypothetical protein